MSGAVGQTLCNFQGVALHPAGCATGILSGRGPGPERPVPCIAQQIVSPLEETSSVRTPDPLVCDVTE